MDFTMAIMIVLVVVILTTGAVMVTSMVLDYRIEKTKAEHPDVSVKTNDSSSKMPFWSERRIEVPIPDDLSSEDREKLIDAIRILEKKDSK